MEPFAWSLSPDQRAETQKQLWQGRSRPLSAQAQSLKVHSVRSDGEKEDFRGVDKVSIPIATSETAAQRKAKTSLRRVQRMATEKLSKAQSRSHEGKEAAPEQAVSADPPDVTVDAPAKPTPSTAAHGETVAQARIALQGLATFIRQQLLRIPAPPKKSARRKVEAPQGELDARETLKGLLKSVKEQVKALDEPTTNIGDIKGTLKGELAAAEDGEQKERLSRKHVVGGEPDKKAPSATTKKREQQNSTALASKQTRQDKPVAEFKKSLLEELFPEDAK
ncbi:hypothetical protein LTS18_000426, partial [Coniosporium uncinatum]